MNYSEKVSTNLFWRLCERFGAQLVTFVVSIILARLLDPAVYGTVALVTVFTTILQVFVDSGFGAALIQKKDSDDLDFSTIFWFNIIACCFLYVGIFFAAPLIASFYGKNELVPIVRVMSLLLVISGLKNVQQSYCSKHFLFKKFFYSTAVGTIISAVISIWMAYAGFGVWALVSQNLINQAIDTLMLWIIVGWYPKFQFSWKRFKLLFNFGWKILASSLLEALYNEIRQLIIGKKYTSEDLAFYNKGKQFPSLIISNINSSIDSVLLPAMSEVQNDKIQVKAMTRRSIKVSTFIMMPMMIGLAVCADSIVCILLTEKWLPCVLYLQIFCVAYAFYPIHTANLNAIKSMGRSDLFLVLEILKKVVGFVAVVITMFISVKAMALSLIVTTIISMAINSWPNKKLLDYSFVEQIKDMLPHIILSLFMGLCVYCINFLPINQHWITLLIQVPFGIIIYVCGSVIFKMESYYYCIDIVKSLLKKKSQ